MADDKAHFGSESARLRALERYDILDTPREEPFDRIAQLIRAIFGVPIGIVSMIDAHRQWYKAATGMASSEADLKTTFCRFALTGTAPLIVPDATCDARFSDNPHVVGAPHVRFYAGMPLRTKDGFNIGTICAIGHEPKEFSAQQAEILARLADIVMDELELRQRAATDSLTGVLSRRAFKDEGGRMFALARRHDQPLAALILDIDHFKSINDSHGHAAGDKVIADVARACQAQLRSTDLIGRLGGEEFAVLLPHTDHATAHAISEKVRLAVGRLEFGTGQKVTASLGVAELAGSDDDLDTLLAHADSAMYEAKTAGRNRCILWKAPTIEKAPRRRVLKAGRILFNNRTSIIDCTVRSLAKDSAGLDVSNAVGIPQRFTLMIMSDNLETTCRIAAQTERHLEVEFG
jgi:diguanylate cyclase (GGDEF)-like protein